MTEQNTAPKDEEATEQQSLISIDDFAKVQLKVGQILEAEKIEKSNKLLKMKVDVGEAEPRQIIAGIAKHYEPEQLPGKRVVVVANLQPAKLMGELSQGMLLAASDETHLELVSPGDIPAGSGIR